MYPNYPNQPGYPNESNSSGYPPNPNYGFGGFNNEYPNNNVPYPTNSSGFGFPGQNQASYPPSGAGGYQPSYPLAPPSNNSGFGYPGQTFDQGYPPSQPSYPHSGGNQPPNTSNFPPFQPPQTYPEFQPPPSQPPQTYPGYQPSQTYPGFQPPPSQPPQTYPGYQPPQTYPGYQPPPSQPPQTYPGHQPPSNQSNNIFPNLNQGSFDHNNYTGQQVHYEGTLKPFQAFNPSDDAAKLYKAMKGFGTDETTLIDILCRRTSQQRQEIAMCYKTGYGKDLLKNIKDETKGNFESLFKALLFTPIQLEAHDLKRALDGAGTDEVSLIDIICTKTNAEMNDLKMTYRQMFNKDLERDVGSDASGYFKRFLVSLIAAHRSDSQASYEKAVQQAKELHKAGEKRLGTDEVTFNRMFASESFPQLKLVCDEYYKLTGHEIEKAIKSEMSGDVERAFLAVAGIAKYPPAYWAQRLYETMIGSGTHDHQLIRIIALRSERDMVQIKIEFQRRFGKTLESFIKGDCSGDYKRGLLCLIGDPHWR